MTFETFIARRYFTTRRKPLFVSFLLGITLSAVSLGVFALVVVLAIMNGFEEDFHQRVLGFKAPISLLGATGTDMSAKADLVKKIDSRIQRVVPFVEGEAVIQSESGASLGVRVRGIAEAPSESRLGALYLSAPFGEKTILLGEELAASLRVSPDFPETIRLIFPIGDVSPVGELIPRVRPVELVGTFHSGFYDFDSKYIIVSYQEAARLFGDDARRGLEVWLNREGATEEVERKIKNVSENIGTFQLQTWRDQNPKLFAAMKLEKIGMFVLLGMILLIATFNIFGLTSLTVMDKIKDMAILRSAGLTARKIKKIFLMQGCGIGLAGVVLGGGSGLLTAWLLKRYPVPLPTTYYLEHLPIAVNPVDVSLVMLLVPVLTTIAALYPARYVSRLSPVESLRYE